MGIPVRNLKSRKTERQLVLEFLKKNKGEAFTVKELARVLGKEDHKILSVNLNIFAKKGGIRKHKVGHSVYYSL